MTARAPAQPSKVVLLGPQQRAPNVGAILAGLKIRRVALVHAGYQERESDDAQLIAALGAPAVNLTLHARALNVFKSDPEFNAAYEARQALLRHMQSFYRIRLEKTDSAARAIAVRHIDAEMLKQEDAISVEQFRQLDANHVERCATSRITFNERWRPGEREVIRRHREEIKALIDDTEALVISGGHVATLLNRLKLFDVLALAEDKPVIAWSAGAMALTENIVLFHDFPPYGGDIAQVLDAGFGLAPGVVVLPNPSKRIRLDNQPGIARFARRMAPAICVAMDPGSKVVFENGLLCESSAICLQTSGEIERQWTGVQR